jgi:hypothetical protein
MSEDAEDLVWRQNQEGGRSRQQEQEKQKAEGRRQKAES